jgi:hypothetical protein
MICKAKAVWQGTGRAGTGNLSTDSGVLAETPYSFRTRFENWGHCRLHGYGRIQRRVSRSRVGISQDRGDGSHR